MPQSRPANALRRIVFALTVLFAAGAAQAASERFQDLSIEVVGQGRPVLMIPGLNSGADTWRETCAALQADKVQCHIVQFPGLAGAPPIKTAAYNDAMRDELLAYIEQRKLVRPVVIGHSLGGFVALKMGIAKPQAIDKLVIVDTLGFLGSLYGPTLTAETIRPMAEGMRAIVLNQPQAHYFRGIAVTAQGMTASDDKVALLRRWGEDSDRATTAQALVEMMTTDLRPELDKVKAPTLVLAGWVGGARYGATRESTLAMFKQHYAKLDGVRIEMSQDGYHFLMWDDPQWLQDQVRGFLAEPKPAG
ncbi:alpha/beta fold hydrolase [Lysobacter enzymogenes]|uniref:alpha/beta fold hydrolase n=1 Tax=Lysobacter enzymogenes TaxID=69 RepID=UPI000899A753|nr:alpha/beta hydrolase [Lysobacter enzymogenes]SDW69120.1 Pimeloyl-ACP methyl ester carboxylesterase [Lysobacter enzymogenes]